MKEIDFIPAWYRASQRRRRDLAVRITCLCVLVAAMVGWSVRNLAVVHAAEADLAAIQESHDLQSESLVQLAALRAREAGLQRRRVLLETARGGARADEVLAELSRLMPDAMALTSVSLQQDERLPSQADDGTGADGETEPMGRMEIEGWAASNADVGSFHTALVRSACFHDVRMIYARPAVRQDRNVREFRLACRLPRFD